MNDLLLAATAVIVLLAVPAGMIIAGAWYDFGVAEQERKEDDHAK